jgi:pimeloyl-ACP methyl ester carboxylesterase
MLTVIVAISAMAAFVIALGRRARGRLVRIARPVGRLVAVDGRDVHLLEAGDGPVVVLVGGTWAPAVSWVRVMDALRTSARVMAWDRPGLGWSDPVRTPRTPIVMAEELDATLRAAGVERPVILVGHSFGGVVARVFADRHPSEVAGLVLLDAAHETQFERFPEPVRRMIDRMGTTMPRLLGLVAQAVSLGFVALRPGLLDGFLAGAGVPSDTTRLALRARIATEPSVLRAMAGETRDLVPGFAEVRELGLGEGSLGALPLRVVSHGRAEGVPPGLGTEVAAAYETTWQALQLEQAALSSRGSRAVAEGVGHDIPNEAPELVAGAVREVLLEAATSEAAQPHGVTAA